MVIGRIRDHVATHNWFAVGIDLAIVVAGVFLGTQVSNWNESRLDRDRGREYRARLMTELAATEHVMVALETYANEVKRHGSDALAVIGDPRRPAGEPFLIDAYQASQAIAFSSRHITYDEIISAGVLETVGPPSLRQKISNFYWRMDRTLALDSGSPPFREAPRTAMPNAIQDSIRAHCDERRQDVGDYLIVVSLPKKCAPGLESGVAKAAAARLRAWPQLGDLLNRQLSSSDSRASTFANLGAGARQTREAIEAYDR